MTQDNQAQDTATQDSAAENEPVFQMQRCYLQDASLEMPNAPEILMKGPEGEPSVDMNFEVGSTRLSEGFYDVIVRATIKVHVKERTVILVEGKQSGLFAIANLPDDVLQHVTNVLCPSMVYPYLRANLADLMMRANVPPVHLPEVNFDALYNQRLQQEAQEQATPETASA